MKTSALKYLAWPLAVLVPAGAARAALLITTASLSGPAESPPNASPGTGTAWVTYDSTAHTLHVQANFSGLLGLVSAAHIHAPTPSPNSGTAGVATPLPTFPGFPSGVTSGTYDALFDLTQTSSWNPSFISNNGGTTAGAEAALVAALQDQRAYFNIHTTLYPGGEIRGFLTPIPEPAAGMWLAGLGLLGFGASRRLLRR